jgi:hypothetical protein
MVNIKIPDRYKSEMRRRYCLFDSSLIEVFFNITTDEIMAGDDTKKILKTFIPKPSTDQSVMPEAEGNKRAQ